MDQSKIILKLTLNQIDLGDLKLDEFKDRLCIQKKIYLVQVAGLDLGYRYNWYIKGPYCRELTQNVYALKEEVNDYEDELKSYMLSDKAVRCVNKAKEIWELPEETTEAEWVELLASLHYLKTIAYWPNKTTKELIIKRLIKAKPHFEDKNKLIGEAWSRLREFGLLDKKSLA